MKKLFSSLSLFFILSAIFFLVCGCAVLFCDKAELHLYLNGFHTLFFDFFFKNFTHLGDGQFVAVALPVVLLLYRKRVLHNFIVGAVTFILVPASVQFFKRVVFYGEPRPVKVFGEEALYLVPDVKISQINSFPSGHSAAIFALFVFLSYMFRDHKRLQIVFTVLAILGAYSRVYLSQHFVVDILAGGILGICCFLITRLSLSYPLDKLGKKNMAV